MDLLLERILASNKKYKHSGVTISYGTAGFRARANLLESILFRVGCLASLRSFARHGSTIGLMVTASHNQEADNGVKIIDPEGEMLDSSWEPHATHFANVSEELLVNSFHQMVRDLQVDLKSDSLAKVVIARDTRASGLELTQAALEGIKCFNATALDLGEMTTPQLHFIVSCYNNASYGSPSLDGYYNKLSNAFLSITHEPKENGAYKPVVTLDCANGIGAKQVSRLLNMIPLKANLVNHGDGILNYNCGADYVKLTQLPPVGVVDSFESGMKYVSFDGDADRIVYFIKDSKTGGFRLLDGDKIATLICKFIQELLVESHLQDKLSLRLVQTAYANGSSTRYAEQVLGVSVDCVPTGVKYLHHQAKASDIGVYFEANGHGTVLFSQNAVSLIRSCNSIACNKLSCVIDLINQTTGDAISDMLLVEVILQHYDWTAEDWDATYTDLPSRQIKVPVSDRNKVQTTDSERKCTLPVGLQESIDAYVSKLGPNSRCFVRPSGTEDVVRVYAESETQEKADTLANAVSEAVVQLVNLSYEDK